MSVNLYNIENIISDYNKQINEKISGLIYLEQLKYILIDKLQIFQNKFIEVIENLKKDDLSISHGENKLLISFIHNLEAQSTIKKEVTNDHLSIVLQGFSSLKIYKNSDKKTFNSFNLYPLTGLVISKNMIISRSLSKDTILLNITNLREEADIEKKIMHDSNK